MIEDGELLKLAFDLKEKRLRSVEGLLFLGNQNKNQYSDDLLSGENESYKKERSKYVQYLAQKHQKSLPTELKREKLVRVIKRTKTLRSKVIFDLKSFFTHYIVFLKFMNGIFFSWL